MHSIWCIVHDSECKHAHPCNPYFNCVPTAGQWQPQNFVFDALLITARGTLMQKIPPTGLTVYYAQFAEVIARKTFVGWGIKCSASSWYRSETLSCNFCRHEHKKRFVVAAQQEPKVQCCLLFALLLNRALGKTQRVICRSDCLVMYNDSRQIAQPCSLCKAESCVCLLCRYDSAAALVDGTQG